jgi:hypothetical protein
MSKPTAKIRLPKKAIAVAARTSRPLRITRLASGKYAVIDTSIRDRARRIVSEHTTEAEAERAARGQG